MELIIAIASFIYTFICVALAVLIGTIIGIAVCSAILYLVKKFIPSDTFSRSIKIEVPSDGLIGQEMNRKQEYPYKFQGKRYTLGNSGLQEEKIDQQKLSFLSKAFNQAFTKQVLDNFKGFSLQELRTFYKSFISVDEPLNTTGELENKEHTATLKTEYKDAQLLDNLPGKIGLKGFVEYCQKSKTEITQGK